MTGAWNQSAYLVSNLLWLAAWAAFLAWRGTPLLRGRVLRAGLVYSLNAPSSLFFQPEYWRGPCRDTACSSSCSISPGAV